MTQSSDNQLPFFLQSYDNLNNYLRETLDELDNTSKGRSFAQFVSKVIPISSLGDRFTDIELSQDSRDGGVDLTSLSGNGQTILYGQTKLTIKKAEEIDTIISKFKNYFDKIHGTRRVTHHQRSMGEVEGVYLPPSQSQRSKKQQRRKTHTTETVNTQHPRQACFAIITLSKIRDSILTNYTKSSYASKEFYHQLIGGDNLHILDGPDVFQLAQSAYRKLHVIPSNFDITFESSFIKNGNVYIGVISAEELKRWYKQFGDALFLENIRQFLGISNEKDRENVNISILETAENHPREMLARNNGITLRASSVQEAGHSRIHLEQASIVNGCQTTMCIVQSSSTDACVLVKVVVSDASWEIAKAANFQNRVHQIALEVARYMRPQALQKAASKVGIQIEDKKESLYDIFDAIYQDKVRYDEAFFLFLGFFSRTPNNVILKNYTEVRSELLQSFQDKDPDGDLIFDLLFMLSKTAKNGQERAETQYTSPSYKNIFQRFWKEGKPDYRALITILASCGCVKTNIYAVQTDIAVMEKFIDDLKTTITNDKEKFIRHYCYAYEAIMAFLLVKNEGETEVEMQRTMFDDLRTSDFSTLYSQICMTSDGRESSFLNR